jgi:divalent metal cation (Fe/Co/Zn/Cd) transporter
VHLIGRTDTGDPWPPTRHFDDSGDRQDAHRAIAVSAAGLGYQVTSEILVHLMDGVDPDLVANAERAALTVPGIAHAHVRARWMGRSLLVEVEGFVPADTRVEAGEALGRAVEEAVAAAVPEPRAVVWSPRALPPT